MLTLESVRCGYRREDTESDRVAAAPAVTSVPAAGASLQTTAADLGTESRSAPAAAGHAHGQMPSGEIVIVDGVTLSVQNGQRIGLLGANGQGKSTLIKTLAGVLPPLAGSVRAGKGLQIGYFAQHQVETLRHDDSPLAHLSRLSPDTREQELRDFLGGFNFRGDMASAPIAPFSGGRKSAPRAGADHLAEAQSAAARRTDQSPRP